MIRERFRTHDHPKKVASWRQLHVPDACGQLPEHRYGGVHRCLDFRIEVVEKPSSRKSEPQRGNSVLQRTAVVRDRCIGARGVQRIEARHRLE
jgi:hypothetical protein